MERLYLFFTLVFGILFLAGVVSSNDILTVEADIFSFPEIVMIDVQDHIYLGNVTVGFETKPTSNDKIFIKNTGTFNVSVQPKLVNFSDSVFGNLYFTKRLSGEDYNYSRIGQFKVDIPWSGELDQYEEEYIYMKLDLRDMENIDEDLIGYKTDIVFYATAN